MGHKSDIVYAQAYACSTVNIVQEMSTQLRLKQSWSQKKESRTLNWRHFGHWRELAGLSQPAHFRVSGMSDGLSSPTEGILLLFPS
jgi:hypothetical protein